MYAASRRIILRGVDGIVFVANSATDRWHENQQSFQEMTANLLAQRLDPRRIPLVLQYNKRDLPQVMPIADLSRALNDRRALEFAAVASKGEGVLETFSAILSLVVDDLRRSYAPLQLPEGQTIEGWTRQAVLGMFGALRLEPKPEAEGESAPPSAIEHMKVRIFTPQDAPVAALVGADSKASDVLAESYAEASAQLGIAVNELREERDLLRVRLDEVERALELATEAPGETDVEARVRAILQVLVTGVRLRARRFCSTPARRRRCSRCRRSWPTRSRGRSGGARTWRRSARSPSRSLRRPTARPSSRRRCAAASPRSRR